MLKDATSLCPYCNLPVTQNEIKRGRCSNCRNFILCAHCRKLVTRADEEKGTCHHCGGWLPTFEREAELNELDERDAEQRAELRQQATKSLQALFDRQFREKLDGLRAISDEEWQAAVEADNKKKSGDIKRTRIKGSRKQNKSATRRAEVIDMACPLCGYGKVKRYPYRRNEWQYVCEGCGCAFAPELEG